MKITVPREWLQKDLPNIVGLHEKTAQLTITPHLGLGICIAQQDACGKTLQSYFRRKLVVQVENLESIEPKIYPKPWYSNT